MSGFKTMEPLPSIPRFVFAFLAKELAEGFTAMADRAADLDDLKAQLATLQLEVIDPALEDVEIRRRRHRAPVASEDRCEARVWNRGRGGRCRRRHVDETETDLKLCGQHMAEWDDKGALRHGSIHEPPPADIFPTATVDPHSEKAGVLY